MNKKIFIIPALMLAGAFTSCDNNEDPIFDDQASERLDKAKQEYHDLLISNGGKWRMEYFANEDEEGYVMLFDFNKDGFVNIAANHKWIDNVYSEERSAWEIIADDGPVLTFNSYNTLFHIFSNPENITGPYAPTNPDQNDKDINEQGYGHNGDYEFVLMEINEQGDSLRLLGKKRGINSWLIRLPENTVLEDYLTTATQQANDIFSSTFNKMYLTDAATGEQFVLADGYKGIISAYPKDGDPVMQTVKQNAILTADGVRFMKPFKIPRADTSKEDFEIETFRLQPDGTLLSANGDRITSVTPAELLSDKALSWSVDPETLTGKFRQAWDKLADEALAFNAKRPLSSFEISHGLEAGEWVTVFTITVGSNKARFYNYYKEQEGNSWSVSFRSEHKDVKTLAQRYPSLREFYEVFSSATYNVSTDTPLKPAILKLADSADASAGFSVNVK